MPKTTNKGQSSTSIENEVKNTNAGEKNNKEVEALKAEIEVLKKLIISQSKEKVKEEEYEEINPNKKTKITSLTFGTLTLYAPNRTHLRFSRFGQTLTVTYAQLCDYVNSCRDFAEAGAFYIHNEDMVKELELSNFYERIINANVVTNIINGNLKDFEILTSLNPNLKESLAELFAQKVYEREIKDLNTIDALSRSLGIDISKKVEEIKSMEEIMKSK